MLRRVQGWEVEGLVRCSNWRMVFDANGEDTGLEVADFEPCLNYSGASVGSDMSGDASVEALHDRRIEEELGESGCSCSQFEEKFGECSISPAPQTSGQSNVEEKFGESSISPATQVDSEQCIIIGEEFGESSISPNGQDNLDLGVNGEDNWVSGLVNELVSNMLNENLNGHENDNFGLRVAFSDVRTEGGSRLTSTDLDPCIEGLNYDLNSYGLGNDDNGEDDLKAIEGKVAGHKL